MPRFIYVFYFAFMSITLAIVLDALAQWRDGRRFAIKRVLIYLLILSPIAAYYGYMTYTSYKSVAHRRAAWAQKADRPVVVAVVPGDTEEFWSGAQYAVNELNASGGVAVESDHGFVKRAIELKRFAPRKFRAIAKDPSIAAIIGNMTGEDAIRASIAFEESGLLFISAGSGDSAQSEHGFATLIRTMPDDEELLLHAYSACAPGPRLALIRSRTQRAAELARHVRAVLPNVSADADLPPAELVTSVSYGDEDPDILDAAATILPLELDAVMLADTLPRAARVVQHLRKLGLSLPILLAHDLDHPSEFEPAEDGDICLAQVDTSEVTLEGGAERRSLAFYQAFEAVSLLAQAWAVAETTNAGITSSTLRAVPSWQGLMGTYDFDESGRIRGKPLTIKRTAGQTLAALTTDR